MDVYLHTVLFALGMTLCMAAGALMAMLSFAIASHRFSVLGASSKHRDSDKSSNRELTPMARFCLANAWKIAPIISLGRRFAFAAAAGFAYLMTIELCGSSLSGCSAWVYPAIFCLSTGAALAANYVFFDLPAAHYGKEHSLKVLNALPAWLKAAYYPSIALEWMLRTVGKKIFGAKAYRESASFNYMDVDVGLRARETESDSISPYTGKIVTNALKLQELDVSDVMLPRSQIVYFDTNESAEENLAKARRTKHNRYPLCNEDLDNCYGIVHIKDIFLGNEESSEIDFMKIRRDAMRLRETDKLETALAKLLKYKLQMALVEDEFGGVIGALTLDAALSELVGKIRDEFDTSPDQTIKSLGRDSYKVSGLASLRKVEDFLDIDFETDEVSTFGGLITMSLGRFPEKGENIYFKNQNLRVSVDEVGERMIKECTIKMEEPKQASDI